MTHDPTPARTRDLETLLADRPDREALQQLWETLPRLAPTPHEPSADARRAAWNRLRATIADPSRTPYTRDVEAPLTLLTNESPMDTDAVPVATSGLAATTAPAPATRRLPRWLAAASVVGFLVAGGAGLRAIPVTYAVPSATNTTAVVAVHLADGSDVWLAPGSTLAVPRSLGWPAALRAASRDVHLKGRGFFVVQRDGRPFVVHTSDAAVRVLGTRFDVLTDLRTEKGTLGTQVTVQEGRVAVTTTALNAESTDDVELGVGQRIVTSGKLSGQNIRTVSAERVGAWRSGGFSALDESLDAVLNELARRFGVEITHAGDIDGTAIVSLFYPDTPAVETVLGDLCTAQGLTLTRTSRGYHITRSSALP